MLILREDCGNLNFADGVIRLAQEVCEKMASCAKAFEAERKLRMTPEQRAFSERAAKMAEGRP
jgi:hypothetical protein